MWRADLCMCSLDRSTLLRKDLLVQPGVGFHSLMDQLDPSYQILVSRVFYPISRLCYTDTPAPHKSLSLGRSRGFKVKCTTFYLLPSLSALDHHYVPHRPYIKSEHKDFSNSLSICRPLTKVKTSGVEYQLSVLFCFSLPVIRIISFVISFPQHPYRYAPKLINIPTHAHSFPLFFHRVLDIGPDLVSNVLTNQSRQC